MVKRCPSCNHDNRDDALFCGSCGTALGGIGSPAGKPVPTVKVLAQPTAAAPVRAPAPGACHYHPSLPAVFICNRCGRPICRDDAKAYLDLILCAQCYSAIAPAIPVYAYNPAGQNPSSSAPPAHPAAVAPPAAPPVGVIPPPVLPVPIRPIRPFWGFVTALVAGIAIIVNAALLLTLLGFTAMAIIFPWITILGPFIAFVLTLIAGLLVIVGSMLMILGYGTIGSLIVFPAAIFSLIGGGGFGAGLVLGIVSGLLAMLGR